VSAPVKPMSIGPVSSSGIGLRLFASLVLLLVAGGIVRSAVATRLDGFTIDEAYRIAAGVSYVRYGDFRINPEHPPLVKLWVGSLISATGFRLSAIRPFNDKHDERDFTEEDVYLHNDPDSVQRRARIAMWTLNGLLLILFTFAVRRTFNSVVALGALLFLLIDPTVAAHMPVVMTDLPVSLLSATAVVLSIPAFRDWAWTDLAACSAALGLSLATKHSGPVFLIFVLLSGAVRARAFRFVKLLATAGGALIILWTFYFFRFDESKTAHEVFNRPLIDKIADVRSPVYRDAINAMEWSHVVPRAYLWGFADTVRGCLEGRMDPITAFGRPFVGTGPRYYFPAMIGLKLPIGLSVLVVMGLILFLRRWLPGEWSAGIATVLAAAVFFLVVLAWGSTYGGIRHALPVVALLAVIAGLAVQAAFSSNLKSLKVAVAAAVAAAAASALPVMRPWEYFNEIIGGTSNAYRYFSDEGVDLGQRGKELAEYYHRVLEPSGEVPLLFYGIIGDPEKEFWHLDWLGRDLKRDEPRFASPLFKGAVLIDARFLGKKPFWDSSSLRETAPNARFGNLLVFRGTCNCGPTLASLPYEDAVAKLYAEKPDWEEAERLLRQSVALDPSAFFVFVDLGNVSLKKGAREGALRAYSEALRRSPPDAELRRQIQEQIRRVTSEPLDRIGELRDPFLE